MNLMTDRQTQFSPEDAEHGFTPESFARLQKAKPDVTSRLEFERNLRDRLINQASKVDNHSHLLTQSWFMSWNKFFVGVGVSLVVVVLAWYFGRAALFPSPRSASELLSGEYEVTEVAANSFGSLASISQADGRGEDTQANTAALSESAAQSSAMAPSFGRGGDGVGSDAKIAPPYYPTDFSFDYRGEALPEIASSQPVFKRIKGLGNSADSLVGSLRLGLFNLQKLVSPRIENLSITENRDRGYNVNVNFVEGSLSLYEDWRTWRLPERECRDEACFNKYRMTIDQIPPDSEVIAIANTFLSEYGIGVERYGLPQVNNSWRIDYERMLSENPSADQSQLYIPDTVNVVYPYIIEGKTVYDEGGTLAGLNVSVNVRHRIVSSMYEVTTQQYNKAEYAGFTDRDAIIALAEKGGFRNYYGIYPAEPGVRKVSLTLGTPKMGMMRVWQYTNYGPGDELYVPALVFPVTNREQSGYYRENVMVPLVKEIIENDNQPPITIMEKAVDSSPGAAVEDPIPMPVPEVRILPAQ